MRYTLRIRPAADADIDGAALSIAQDNLPAALRFLDAVQSTCSEIRQHPARWPRYELDHPQLAHIRKRSVIGFRNYLVFYHIQNDAVEIIRVLHGARDIPVALADNPTEE